MLPFAHLGLALLLARPFKKADLAFLAIGSMLPDIIDKPLGTMLFGTPSMGRIFAHTMLFLLLLSAWSLYLRDASLASLSCAVLVHLGLDSMWSSPATLFWPILGPFPMAAYVSTSGYLQQLFLELKNPGIFIPECIGFAYLIFFSLEKIPWIWARIRIFLAKISR